MRECHYENTQAHLGSLRTGAVAVVAGGLDVVYPPENKDLCRRIAESGAVIAEQPLGARPTARHFPRRNRIVSGLALGVVVVEATLRSGSLITARLAAEQGREVFAVPGSPLDPRHRGTNALIRDGATLVESAADAIEALRAPPARRGETADLFASTAEAPPAAGSPPPVAESHRSAVLAALDPAPVGVDELVRQCQLPASEIMVVVLELELAGRLRRHGNGRVSAKAAPDGLENASLI